MFWLCIILILLIAPVAIGFVYDWSVPFFSVEYAMSAFALSSVIHFFLQLVFAKLNRLKMNKVPPFLGIRSCAVQVTGWKEDPELFEQCLLSIRGQTIIPAYILFCSDGNEEEDAYMTSIFKKVFPTGSVSIRLDKVLKEETPEKLKEIMSLIRGKRYISISQPHRGKRYAMYTQMKICLELGVDYLLLIDSDTIIQSTSIDTLVTTIEHTKADTVTGDVNIYNQVNLLSFLVSLKYWYAFNVERASQSFFGNVSCVAGPFGLYRINTIRKIIEPWMNQTFMGKECTFGDDRHLTNLILKENGTAYYNHNAVCYTDTPIEMKRFISQQTRWGKSFIREYLLNFTWFHPRQLWMLYDLSFLTVYSWLLTFYLVYLVLQFNLLSNLIFLFAILMATLVRALYALSHTRDVSHLVFVLYAYVYFLLLIPSKVWACFTMNVTQWGTGSRLLKSSKNIDMIPVYLWVVFMVTCFLVSLGFQIHDGFRWTHWLFLGLDTGMTLGGCLIYKIYKPATDVNLSSIVIK